MPFCKTEIHSKYIKLHHAFHSVMIKYILDSSNFGLFCLLYFSITWCLILKCNIIGSKKERKKFFYRNILLNSRKLNDFLIFETFKIINSLYLKLYFNMRHPVVESLKGDSGSFFDVLKEGELWGVLLRTPPLSRNMILKSHSTEKHEVIGS